MKRLLAVSVVLSWLAPARVLAAAGADTEAFLLMDSNARAAAMGGAYTALASGAGALDYNPAGLSNTGRHEVSFMHNQHFQGITQEFLHYASPRGWGATLNQLSFGDVPVTTLAAPDGGLGQTTLTDLALGAGYGFKVGGGLSVGVGGKYIRETLDSTTRDDAAFDFGALYAVPLLRGLSLGAALQNLGQTVRYDQASENQPLVFRLGGSYGREWLGASHTLSLDVIRERNDTAYLAVGVETVILKALALRLGYNQGNDAGVGMTAGVGYEIQNFSFDYAIVPYGSLGYSNRAAVTFRWGGGGRPAVRKGQG
ncbi:MAG: PorV/PorQ family protein [Elusimicrobia bacterium]|nr:PorV/PorQ family protein [Elusimicrobiota bacterium]